MFGLQYGTCLISPFWRLEFGGVSRVLENWWTLMYGGKSSKNMLWKFFLYNVKENGGCINIYVFNFRFDSSNSGGWGLKFGREVNHKHANEIFACAYLGGVCFRISQLKRTYFITHVFVVSLNEGGWQCRSSDDWSPGSHPGSHLISTVVLSLGKCGLCCQLLARFLPWKSDVDFRVIHDETCTKRHWHRVFSL